MTGYSVQIERICTYRKGKQRKTEDKKMANGWREGTIGIPVKDGGTKKIGRAHV